MKNKQTTTNENTIARIGFEIEGEWSKELLKRINLDNLGKMVHDGSIHSCGESDGENDELTCDIPEYHNHDEECYTERELVCTDESDEHEHDAETCYNETELVCDIEEDHEHEGDSGCYTSNDTDDDSQKEHVNNLEPLEYNSHPINRATFEEEATAFFNRLQQEWQADTFHANNSMGFHVHLSFDPLFPPSIFSKEFVDFFHEEANLAFPEVMKKRGNNSYCNVNIRPQEIENRQNDNRYHSINLWPAWCKHQTVEIRLWPSDEPSKMLSYLLFTVQTFEKFLALPFQSTFETAITIDTISHDELVASKEIANLSYNDTIGGHCDTISDYYTNEPGRNRYLSFNCRQALIISSLPINLSTYVQTIGGTN